MQSKTIRHAPFQQWARVLLPRSKDLGSISRAACGCESNNIEYARQWHTISCSDCLKLPAISRGKALFEKLNMTKFIPINYLNISFFDDKIMEQFNIDYIKFLHEWYYLPGRYFVYFKNNNIDVCIESWGTKISGDKDIYFHAIERSGFPYRIVRFGDEFSRNCSIERSLNIITGHTEVKYEFRGVKFDKYLNIIK